ncbi:hypothetical protein Bca4012_025651 [Brassica carinata]|uniref:Uncharacterized protein n=1 Tax=Brassica carinata TaxID=52824 RepID=A0A8X7VH64_BRACI|nr:hypothetical protein Bca52824_022758 [Brassica carinata]
MNIFPATQQGRVKDWISSRHLKTKELTDVLSNFPDISIKSWTSWRKNVFFLEQGRTHRKEHIRPKRRRGLLRSHKLYYYMWKFRNIFLRSSRQEITNKHTVCIAGV